MRSIRNIMTSLLAAAAIASGVQAQVNDPAVLTSENYSGTGAYWGARGEDTTTYVPCWAVANGGTQMRLNTITLGLYRNSTAVDVGLEVTVRNMTYDPTVAGSAAYGIGSVVATGTASLTANTAGYAVISTLTWTWGSTDPTTRPVINLQTVQNGPNGWGGYWIGVRWTGANAADTSNGMMVTNDPTVGTCPNRFGLYTTSTASFAYAYYFGTTTGTDGVTRENPAHFYVDCAGLVTDAGTPGADYVYGETCLANRASYWKPYDTTTGTAYTFYSSNFVTASAGQALKPTSVSLSLWRQGSVATPAPAVDVELALCKMTWDATNSVYGVGDVVATSTVHLNSRTDISSEKAVWNIPAGTVSVPLNTDNAANAGLGGYWVRGRFLNTTLSAAQGVEIGYRPNLGSSFNSFCMFDATNTLLYYTFGQFNSTYTATDGSTAYYVKPSRFLTDVHGAITSATPPCPADLNHDGVVNGADLGIMLGSWGACVGCPADLNADGVVNGADLGLLLGAWGACPQ